MVSMPGPTTMRCFQCGGAQHLASRCGDRSARTRALAPFGQTCNDNVVGPVAAAAAASNPNSWWWWWRQDHGRAYRGVDGWCTATSLCGDVGSDQVLDTRKALFEGAQSHPNILLRAASRNGASKRGAWRFTLGGGLRDLLLPLRPLQLMLC